MKQGEGFEVIVDARLVLTIKDWNEDIINSAIITPDDKIGWVERIEKLSVVIK